MYCFVIVVFSFNSSSCRELLLWHWNPFTLFAKLKNWTLFSVASVLEVNKNSIVFRLARHLCSSTPLVIYIYGRTYVILYFDPRVFVLVMWSTPSQIALNRILWFIDQYPCHPRNWIVYRLNFFAGAVFLFELVAMVSQCALCHGYKPCATVLLENTLSTRLLRR